MIAGWLGLSRGACAAIRARIEVSPRETVYALKSENAAHWKTLAAAYRARSGDKRADENPERKC
jgi:hypothetical protein